MSYCADILVLGSTLRQFMEQNKFDKRLVEKGILGWMPSKVRQALILGVK